MEVNNKRSNKDSVTFERLYLVEPKPSIAKTCRVTQLPQFSTEKNRIPNYFKPYFVTAKHGAIGT